MEKSARLQKEALRIQARTRTEDTGRNAALSPLICEKVAGTKEFHEARWIGLFCGRPWEVDLLPLWKLRPEACVFPKARPKDRSMTFYRIGRLEDLKPGYASILEPPALADRAVAEWSRPDLILVPGFLFGRDGARIGSGYGYYDRFLTYRPTQRWGACFGHQIAKETLAQESTDVRMEALVWEQGVVPCTVS